MQMQMQSNNHAMLPIIHCHPLTHPSLTHITYLPLLRILLLSLLNISRKILPHPLKIIPPRARTRRRLPLTPQHLIKRHTNLHHRLTLLTQLLQLLLHRRLLRLKRQDPAEMLAQTIQASCRLGGREQQEFGEDETAEDLDLVLVGDARDDAVVEGGEVEALARGGGFE